MVKFSHIFRNPLGTTQGIFYFRKLALLLSVLLAFKSFSQATLKITDAKKNFGFVKRGEVIKNEFEITNVGNAPLLITDVEIGCSCTTVDFSKKPILPGQKAIILVIFNTATTYGRQDRTVSVISNDPHGPHKLRYKGIVSNR